MVADWQTKCLERLLGISAVAARKFRRLPLLKLRIHCWLKVFSSSSMIKSASTKPVVHLYHTIECL
jgi:hypothetical protein